MFIVVESAANRPFYYKWLSRQLLLFIGSLSYQYKLIQRTMMPFNFLAALGLPLLLQNFFWMEKNQTSYLLSPLTINGWVIEYPVPGLIVT